MEAARDGGGRAGAGRELLLLIKNLALLLKVEGLEELQELLLRRIGLGLKAKPATRQ
jgi:hypothetical protein